MYHILVALYYWCTMVSCCNIILLLCCNTDHWTCIIILKYHITSTHYYHIITIFLPPSYNVTFCHIVLHNVVILPYLSYQNIIILLCCTVVLKCFINIVFFMSLQYCAESYFNTILLHYINLLNAIFYCMLHCIPLPYCTIMLSYFNIISSLYCIL